MTENHSHAESEKQIINSSHRPRWWEEPSSSSNPPSDISSEEHFNILVRILFPIYKITSLLSLREYTLYEFVETNTFSLRTPEGRRNIRWSYCLVQRAVIYPHVLSTFILGHYRRGWICGAQVHHYWCISLWRVVWRVTLDRQGTVVSPYS
jgi:hypothetical protein